jgi:hypothetical protein
VAASLIIYVTPYTDMSASSIIALAEQALNNHIDVADTPSFMGLPDYTALLIAAEVSTESDFNLLMAVLRRWCDQARPSGTFELTIRVESLDLLIELVAPVEGHKAITALFVDLVEAVRLLKQSDLLQKVTRILLPAGRLHGEVRANIGDRLAYLIAPSSGTVRKALGTGKLPSME